MEFFCLKNDIWGRGEMPTQMRNYKQHLRGQFPEGFLSANGDQKSFPIMGNVHADAEL